MRNTWVSEQQRQPDESKPELMIESEAAHMKSSDHTVQKQESEQERLNGWRWNETRDTPSKTQHKQNMTNRKMNGLTKYFAVNI